MNQNEHDAFRWIEVAAKNPRGGFIRNQYRRFGDAGQLDQWVRQYHNTDIYQSVCRFAGPGRDGGFILPQWVLDIDCHHDPGIALTEARRLLQLFEQRWELPAESVHAYFSGCKGIHLLIPTSIFGPAAQERTAEMLLGVLRRLARKLQRESSEHLDTGIYHAAALLRWPGSIHSESKLYKTPLDAKDVFDCSIGKIQEMARTPREWQGWPEPPPCPKAGKWLQEALAHPSPSPPRRPDPGTESGPVEGWTTPPCIRRIEQGVLPDGMRHKAYLTIARFWATTGMNVQEAIDRLTQIDARHPIRDRDYIERVVRYAYQKPGFEGGCPHPVLQSYCGPQRCPHRRVANAGATAEQTTSASPDDRG